MIGCPNLETLTSEISCSVLLVHERGTQTKETCAHVQMVLICFKFDASKCKARIIASELQNVPSDI